MPKTDDLPLPKLLHKVRRCRLCADLPPRSECAPAWRRQLLAAMPDLQLTVLIGLHAQRWHLATEAGRTLTETVADWKRYWPETVPLPHPSPRNARWLRQNPYVGNELLPALQARVRELLC